MHSADVKLIALLFNESINNHDLIGLAKLMTDNHTFISKLNDVQQGREAMVNSWEKFFQLFPKYRNDLHFIYSKGDFVIMVGNAEALEGPAICTAYIENGKISEWRVYDDNEKNRSILHIDESILAPIPKKNDELGL